MAIQSTGLFSTIGTVFGLVVRTVGIADKSLGVVEKFVDTADVYSNDFKQSASEELKLKQEIRRKEAKVLLEA